MIQYYGRLSVAFCNPRTDVWLEALERLTLSFYANRSLRLRICRHHTSEQSRDAGLRRSTPGVNIRGQRSLQDGLSRLSFLKRTRGGEGGPLRAFFSSPGFFFRRRTCGGVWLRLQVSAFFSATSATRFDRDSRVRAWGRRLAPAAPGREGNDRKVRFSRELHAALVVPEGTD